MSETAKDKLAAIVAGLDEATPGPWFEGDHWVFVQPSTGEPTHPLENIFDHDKPQANAAHIARCDPDTMREIAAYAADLRSALEECQKALSMMITPDIIGSTSVAHAFATATAAECRARSALRNSGGGET